MDTRLQDRIAIITGASSGLGKATALKFASCGARIVCADLDSVKLEEEITAKHGDNAAIFVKCDVTKEDHIRNLMAEAVKFGGRIDCICNYAGIAVEVNERNQMSTRAHEFSTEEFDLTFAVNTRGVWLCCKYALQQMLKQEPREPNARGDRIRGWIVNVASIAGVVGHRNAVAYTPSKHAVVGMTKQMALDYAPDRIHVNCLCPGFADTPMIGKLLANEDNAHALAGQHPWNALGRPDDIAGAAVFLCSDEASWITGHSLLVDGGYTAQ